ncbi:MAG: GNAT family N-acetyltransferase, partial [Gaiella sp.]
RRIVMPPLQLAPLTHDHLDAAASLLAQRQRAQRRSEPALAARFEEPALCLPEIEALLATDGASGSVALRSGRAVGFLLGAPRADGLWGPNAWVEAAGHATEEPEVARDLYAHAAARWVEEGRTAHYAIVPATDRALVDAWFRLGFGHQHVHALREVAPGPERAPGSAVVVRDAERRDIPALARIELELPRHQARSPVFSPLPLPRLEEATAEWEADFGDGRFTAFVAEVDGVVVGSAVGCALSLSSMHRSLADVDDAGFLGFAAVAPEARGRGIGSALLDAVHGWAREQGHRTLVTDWRMTNLLSSRTWASRGFRPTLLRLHRVIGW